MKRQSSGNGLMGLGVVGGQVARVLLHKAEVLPEQVVCPLALRKIMVLPQDSDKPLAQEIPPNFLPPMLTSFSLEPG